MPIVKCKICKKEFYAKPNLIKKGWGKFCSRICQHQSYKKGKIVSCSICDKEVWRKPRQLAHSKSKKYFCSKSCQTLWRNKIVYIGKNHPNWKNGETIYRKILERSGGKQFCTLCKTIDQRVLAVHHIDKNKKNVKLNNLIWLCFNCHFLVHHYKEVEEKLMAAMV